jgi:hypothetical protein
MKKTFYIVALLLAVIWFLGFFALGAGRVIHSLLMVGGVFYLQGVITCKDFKTEQSQ